MESKASTLRGKRILICEDEGLIQLQWSRVLKRHGASVIDLTSSGDECVDLARVHRPDIVLMDVSIVGTNGWEATRRILQHHDPCIVMVTGLPQALATHELEGLRIGGYIQKPITSSDLVREVINCYSRSQTR